MIGLPSTGVFLVGVVHQLRPNDFLTAEPDGVESGRRDGAGGKKRRDMERGRQEGKRDGEQGEWIWDTQREKGKVRG